MKLMSLVSLTLTYLITQAPLLACPGCQGDTTGSRASDAAAWGVLAMVILMFGMLGTLGGVIYYFHWRAKNPLPDYSELLEATSKPL